jgi:hypothetical protein
LRGCESLNLGIDVASLCREPSFHLEICICRSLRRSLALIDEESQQRENNMHPCQTLMSFKWCTTHSDAVRHEQRFGVHWVM